MKVLVWRSKYGNVIVAARNTEEEDRAWLYLFKQMDEMGYYHDLGDDEDEDEAYLQAKAGEAKGARWLLGIRDNYEYKEISPVEVVEP